MKNSETRKGTELIPSICDFFFFKIRKQESVGISLALGDLSSFL